MANGPSDSKRPIDRAIDIAGSQSALARLIGVSQMAVSRWQRGVSPVTPENVLAVEAATGISRHDLRPDLYPREAPTAAAPTSPVDLEPAR